MFSSFKICLRCLSTSLWLAVLLSATDGTAADAVPPSGKELVQRVFRALENRDGDEAKALVAELERLGDAAQDGVPDLLQLLDSHDSDIVISAVHLLGAVGAKRSEIVDPLVRLLSHENFHVQYWVCRTLGKLKAVAKPAVPVLITKLKTGNVSVRRHAAIALGDIGPVIGDAGIEALLDAIYDRTQPVRSDAIVALGKLGELARPAVPTLRTVMKKQELSVRIEAAFTVWKLSGELNSTLPILIEELDGDSAPWEAAQAIGQMGPLARAAVPALSTQLESEEPEIRIAAANALGMIGKASSPAITQLEWMLDDPEEEAQIAANEALDRIRISE